MGPHMLSWCQGDGRLRLTVTGVVTVGLLLWPASRPAAACSCLEQPLGQMVASAEVAVVGTVLEVGPVVDVPPEGRLREYLIDVTEVHGSASNPLRAYAAPADDSSCGLEAAVGDSVGWLLGRRAGVLVVDQCSATPVDALAAAPGVEPPLDDAGHESQNATFLVALGALLATMTVGALLILRGGRGRHESDT